MWGKSSWSSSASKAANKSKTSSRARSGSASGLSTLFSTTMGRRPRASALEVTSSARVLAPTATEERLERHGRVYIYDGLRESDVDWALDTQFERIDSMMFVRTIRVTEAGELEMDSDCD